MKFILEHDGVAGQARAQALLRGQAERGGLRAQARDRLGRRLQRRKIEHRPDGDEAALVRRLRGLPGQQRLPGQRPRRCTTLAFNRQGLGGFGETVQRAAECGGGIRVSLVQRLAQHAGEPAQRGIGGECPKQGLNLGQAVAERRQLRGFQVQQPIAPEERLAVGIEDLAEQLGPGGQRRRQTPGAALGQVGSCRLDDHDQRVP